MTIIQKFLNPLHTPLFIILGGFALLFLSETGDAASSRVTMKDGRVLTGEIAPIESVAVNPNNRKSGGDQTVEKIVVIDDQLRLIYVPKNLILDIAQDDLGASAEIFRFRQPIFRSSSQAAVSLGAYKTTEPFDPFGRRTIYFNGTPLIQGITEIAPGYVRAQGINMGIDMRFSPHSFRRDFLSSMIRKAIDPESLSDRLRIYLFYTQAELFEEAAAELEEIIRDFKDKPENTEQLDAGLRMIRQLSATRLVDELKLRRDAGQHRNVRSLIEEFSNENISTDLTQSVRALARQYDEEDEKKGRILDELRRMTDTLTNEDQKREASAILDEIARELNPNTSNRFAEFLLSLNDESLSDEQRLAIGISGWLAGNAGTDNRLELALSMVRLRDKINAYLIETAPTKRAAILEEIKSEEASTPLENPARVLRYMKPPLETEPTDPSLTGFYQIEVPSFEEGKTFQYLVQLPPEYDPNRKYPTVVTLHGEKTTPQMQIDWWAGSWNEKTADDGTTLKQRFGQGTRFGYIVVAPRWANEEETYHGSGAETGAVLYALRDAMRRFSIDTDRVFLSGHSAGGDAAWDLGLSHPDLWAGIIPICGKAIRYPFYLRKNARYVPVYAVNGELDGGKTSLSKGVLDPGMNQVHPFDMTCVVFRGRGNESFSDELIRIFEWMGSRSRNFFPKERLTVYSMRPWDYYFWMAELGDFPEKTMILPINWTVGKLPAKYSPAKTDIIPVAENKIKIISSAQACSIYLAPEIVNFDQRIEVTFNGKRMSPPNGEITPSLDILLDDARTRADRLHPFRARLDYEKK
ncbi:MAG: hypothetical protein J6S40_00680 [Thermoguttaceae bacterium]|nr:hypothetical protein [Thermoguttaceae bacterium]